MSRWKALPWGSPISPIVANLFMENFEIRALQSSSNPPLLWKRFVDDTFVILKKIHKDEFLTHINSVDHNIQFTTEEPSLMDQYLSWTF